MSPAQQTDFIESTCLQLKVFFQAPSIFTRTDRKKKTKKNLKFNLYPEPPVNKALHSVSLCRCMLVVQLLRKVWQGHPDQQLTSFAQEWDLCDREARLTSVARIFAFGNLRRLVVLNSMFH